MRPTVCDEFFFVAVESSFQKTCQAVCEVFGALFFVFAFSRQFSVMFA